MLNLASRTGSAWLERSLANLDELLIDHAHCEKKAAGVAVGLLFRYPHLNFLLAPLSELAREELTHFEATLGVLERRGVRFRRQRPSPYGRELRALVRDHEPDRLIDSLLCSALIEARSCERFQLLADAIEDRALAGFYRGLLASEARHHRIYVDLATRAGESGAVRERLEALAAEEAAILSHAPDWPRMHS